MFIGFCLLSNTPPGWRGIRDDSESSEDGAGLLLVKLEEVRADCVRIPKREVFAGLTERVGASLENGAKLDAVCGTVSAIVAVDAGRCLFLLVHRVNLHR
jgi:hypothetical protein